MTLPTNFTTLAESQNYILGNVFEYGSIIDKRTGHETYIGDSYGDPTFALIDKNETWALMFGHDSYLWTVNKISHLTEELSSFAGLFKWPYDARQINDYEVEILDDPWSNNPGIYNFNILTNEVKKMRDFGKLTVPYDSTTIKIAW